MAGRKLLKASPPGQFQLFAESLERDPLQLSLDPAERARIRAAEEARTARKRMMELPPAMFTPAPLAGRARHTDEEIRAIVEAGPLLLSGTSLPRARRR